jgi:lysozyme family protein
MTLVSQVDPVRFAEFLEHLNDKGMPVEEVIQHVDMAKRNLSPAADFSTAFERLMGHEGGYVNNPNDPGGETNWGISKRSYPKLDIRNLTRDSAALIYRNDFWDRIQADSLPFSISFQLFDFAINSGIETAIRYFQRALGVADDGHWGPVSQAAADKASETDMVLLLNAERLEFMTKLSNWSDASRGWSRRIANNLRFASQDT